MTESNAAASRFQFEMSDGEMEASNNIDGGPTGDKSGTVTADGSAIVPSGE